MKSLRTRLHSLTDRQHSLILYHLLGQYAQSESDAARQFNMRLREAVGWQERSRGKEQEDEREATVGNRD